MCEPARPPSIVTQPPDGGSRSITVADRLLPSHCSRVMAGRSRSPVRQLAVDREVGSDSDTGQQSEQPARAKRNKPGRDRRRRRQAARAANSGHAHSSGSGFSPGATLRTTAPAASSEAGRPSAQLASGRDDAPAAVSSVEQPVDATLAAPGEPDATSAIPITAGSSPDATVTDRDAVTSQDMDDAPSQATDKVTVNQETAVHLLHDDDFSVCDHYVCSRGTHPFCRLCQVPGYGEMCVHIRDFEAGLDFEC